MFEVSPSMVRFELCQSVQEPPRDGLHFALKQVARSVLIEKFPSFRFISLYSSQLNIESLEILSFSALDICNVKAVRWYRCVPNNS